MLLKLLHKPKTQQFWLKTERNKVEKVADKEVEKETHAESSFFSLHKNPKDEETRKKNTFFQMHLSCRNTV